MARAIWSGSISFGLVNVPIKVVTAVRQQEVRFSQLHGKDGVKLQYKRVCPLDGEEVPYEDIVKGYEISPDEFVVIQPEELEALDPENTRLIDIEEFVDLVDIDPLYYDKSYYLVPNTGGSKAYRVLLDAMRSAGKVALGRVVLRTKQYLVALRPVDDALVMTTLNYADEVVATDSLDGLPQEATASERELTMARQLIEALAGPFEPGKYHDDHREKVLALIEAKASGAEVVSQPAKEEPSLVVDLMAALEQSLQSARGGSSSGNGSAKVTPLPKRRSSSKAKSTATAAAGQGEERVPARAAAAKKKTSSSTKVAAKGSAKRAQK